MKDAVVRQRHRDLEQEVMPPDDRIKMRNFMENSVARQSGPQQVRQVRFYSQSGWGS